MCSSDKDFGGLGRVQGSPQGTGSVSGKEVHPDTDEACVCPGPLSCGGLCPACQCGLDAKLSSAASERHRLGLFDWSLKA